MPRWIYGPLAAAFVAFTVGYCVSVVIVLNGPPPPGTTLDEDRIMPPGAVGTVTREEAVQLYVRSLNEQDLDGMLALSGRAAYSVVAAEARLRMWGGTAIVLDTAEVPEGVTPVQAVATLRGTSTKGAYAERLALTRVQGRWLVVVSSWFGEPRYP